MGDRLQELREMEERGTIRRGHIVEMFAEIERLSARVAELEADNNDQFMVIEKQGNLLRGVAAAIKGEPPPLVRWSHHDLPELAAALRAENARLRAALEEVPPIDGTATALDHIVWYHITRAEALK